MTKSIIGMVFLGITCTSAKPQHKLSRRRSSQSSSPPLLSTDNQRKQQQATCLPTSTSSTIRTGGIVGRSLINGFAKYVESTAYKCEIKRVVAERDLVVVHSHSKAKPDDRRQRCHRFFRVEKGLIVEHWM